MGLFGAKTAEEKAQAQADQLTRMRYLQVRSELHDTLTEAANNGAADQKWIDDVMPAMACETAKAWLEVCPEPAKGDLERLWNDDLRSFWNRSVWPDYTAIRDLAQEISVVIYREVTRLAESGESANDDAPDSLLGKIPSWSSVEQDGPSELQSSNELAPTESAPDLNAVPVVQAVEVWRWAHGERLDEEARYRLARVARVIEDNAIATEDIGDMSGRSRIAFESTEADLAHAREMIQYVARWVATRPGEFESALGLYVDGGGNRDSL